AEARVCEVALHGRGGDLEDQLLEAHDAPGEGHQSVSSSCSTTRAAGVSRSQASTLSMTTAAWRASLLTVAKPSTVDCQASWSSTSAAATSNFARTRSMIPRTMR